MANTESAGALPLPGQPVAFPGCDLPAAPAALIRETLLSLQVEGVGEYALLCTPTERRALAVGFLHAEGLIASLEDILLLQDCPEDPDTLRLRLAAPPPPGAERNLLITSACGLCGAKQLATLRASIPPVGTTLQATAGAIQQAAADLRAGQALHRLTRGCHAAGLFRPGAPGFLAFAEDIGRHNALDKAVGLALLQRAHPAGHAVMLTSRISFEMVAKAARAGIELIAAVSAPSALAVEAATAWNITLCASVRDAGFVIYTHASRMA